MMSSNRYPSKYKQYDDTLLWSSPILKLSIVCILLVAFAIGLYLESCRVLNFHFPAFDHFRNNAALIMYSSIGLLFLSGSALIIYKGIHQESWSRMEHLFFYVCITLAISYFLTGYQYLLFGEWKYENFMPYIIIRTLINGFLIVMLFRFLLYILAKR